MLYRRNSSATLPIVLCLAFLASFSAAAGPEIGNGYLRHYRVLDLEANENPRNKLVQGQDKIESFSCCLMPHNYKGRQTYKQTRTEKTFTGDTLVWTFIMDNKNMSLLRAEKKVISRSGKTVRHAWVDYEDPMYDYPERVAHIDTISNVIQAMDIKAGQKRGFYLILGLEVKPWHMYSIVEDLETVSVPAGNFECYKVRLELDLEDVLGKWSWGARLFRPLIPEYYMWVEKDPPHGLVKFTGKFGLEGTAPLQAWELIKIEPPCPPQK